MRLWRYREQKYLGKPIGCSRASLQGLRAPCFPDTPTQIVDLIIGRTLYCMFPIILSFELIILIWLERSCLWTFWSDHVYGPSGAIIFMDAQYVHTSMVLTPTACLSLITK